jgi:hypothetical protein
LANPSKKLAIKRLIESLKPSIILLQEIMIEGEKTIQELSKFLSGWDFNFIDAIGRSSGNITGWKRCSFTLTNSWDFSFRSRGFPLLHGYGKEIYVLNVYGPYWIGWSTGTSFSNWNAYRMALW